MKWIFILAMVWGTAKGQTVLATRVVETSTKMFVTQSQIDAWSKPIRLKPGINVGLKQINDSTIQVDMAFPDYANFNEIQRLTLPQKSIVYNREDDHFYFKNLKNKWVLIWSNN